MSKLRSLSEAVSAIPDGAMIALVPRFYRDEVFPPGLLEEVDSDAKQHPNRLMLRHIAESEPQIFSMTPRRFLKQAGQRVCGEVASAVDVLPPDSILGLIIV